MYSQAISSQLRFALCDTKINHDMCQFEKQGIEMEEQRKQILKELEQKYRNATKLAQEYEEKIKANNKTLEQTRTGRAPLGLQCSISRSMSVILVHFVPFQAFNHCSRRSIAIDHKSIYCY